MFIFACASVQGLTGQQQQPTSSSESEYDFPEDDGAFAASEFREDGVDFAGDQAGSGEDFAARAGAAAAAAASHDGGGKRALFEGYRDPSRQFSGHARAHHQDARYEPATPGRARALCSCLENSGKLPPFCVCVCVPDTSTTAA